MDPAFDPFVGTPAPNQLGPYRVVERIGVGGVGTLFRAVHQDTGVEAAVKVLKAQFCDDEGMRQRFLAEPQTQARLDHPHVLRIFEWGEFDQQPWFAMELATGSLEQIHEPVPVEQALEWIFDALLALSAAHRVGIIHRDVKPHNLLFGADGKIRLADFGSARLPLAGATFPGEWLGTLGYMSPEQRQAARWVGPASDVSGMGATLFRMVTGRAPPGLFEGGLEAKAEDLPQAVFEVVARATRYRADERFPGARAMATEVAHSWSRISGKPASSWLTRLHELAPPADATAPRAPVRDLPPPPPLPWWRRLFRWWETNQSVEYGLWGGVRDDGPITLELAANAAWATWESPTGIRVTPLVRENPFRWREQRDGGGTYIIGRQGSNIIAAYVDARSGTRTEFTLVNVESAAGDPRSR